MENVVEHPWIHFVDVGNCRNDLQFHCLQGLHSAKLSSVGVFSITVVLHGRETVVQCIHCVERLTF